MKYVDEFRNADLARAVSAEIAVELVAPVRPGEVLLTHGGVAIGRVTTEKLTADG